MKAKKLDKRLLLNKKTIADLSEKEMERLWGGATVKDCTITCETCRCTLTNCFLSC